MKDFLHILLVDDDKVLHQTLGDYLQNIGHEVISVYEGYSALEILKDQFFDLALVDIRMPGIDGMTLLEKIPEISPWMPVVIISGHGSMDSVIQALRLGAADFLTKPVKLLELDAILEKCINLFNLPAKRITPLTNP